jgi:hypothetical protein
VESLLKILSLICLLLGFIFVTQIDALEDNLILANGYDEEEAIEIAKRAAKPDLARRGLTADDMIFTARYVPNSDYKISRPIDEVFRLKGHGMRNGYWEISYYRKGQKLETARNRWAVTVINVDKDTGDAFNPSIVR